MNLLLAFNTNDIVQTHRGEVVLDVFQSVACHSEDDRFHTVWLTVSISAHRPHQQEGDEGLLSMEIQASGGELGL